MPKLKSALELEELRKDIVSKRDHNRLCFTVCSGTACLAIGSKQTFAAFKKELEKQGLKDRVALKATGCPGFCEQGPIVVVYPQEICYLHVQPEDVAEIISQSINGQIVERLLYVDPVTGKAISRESDIPFYQYQKRLILGNNRLIDATKIEDYIALDGYKALSKALFDMTPEQVMTEIEKANLRGRGGGGFPTARKWKSTRDAPGDPKYVIVNCDEGDPGAFMNRALMEGNPHSVLEGLTIGAYAMGSHEGFIYVRQEYPLAAENIAIAIKQAEDYGLLGKNILGSDFDFIVKVHKGAGAFVSGESSALMNAIEGKVGEPRPKYTHTAEKGIWDKPSCLNNVETWADVPFIINNGADWFASIGTERSKGTKIFSLVGKVNNTGLVEVPLGTPLKDIIYKIGGGVSGNKKFKAVQTGGPSGGCIPEQYLDSPVDFDELTKLGAMMGSGGMIVTDEDTCMVDFAKYFVHFLSEESCGKCVPCREGINHMLDILTRITEGKGQASDIQLLEDLARMLKEASLCALGQTAANPVLTTLKYFRHEYDAHIYEKRCPAGVCKALIAFYIEPDKCQACLICARNCPVNAITGGKNLIHIIDQSKCIKCDTCLEVCPPRFSAIKKISGEPVPALIPEQARVIERKG
jgi:NADH:ubiquinone oxidoreductase subunit F (NADH-binding)/(2Fe-2S) ferredoxin